jgi:two-component system sensor kinase FixL
MAIASSLDASAGSSVAGRVASWLAPALLALPAASVSWSIGGGLRLEVGVATAAFVLVGWRGWTGALVGAALADFVLAPDAAQAITLICATALAGSISGGALRRALAEPRGIDTTDPTAPVLAAGLGALAGAVALFAYGDSGRDSLHLLGSLWTGGLLTTPLLLELFATTERRLSRALAVFIAAIALAIVAYVMTPLSASAVSSGLVSIAVVFTVAAVAASRTQLALALALATFAGVTASALPSINQIAVGCGILIGVTLLLAIGLADRQVSRLGAAEAASQHLFDATMRLLPLGILRIGLDGAVRYANPMFEAITGLTAASAPGNWLDTIHIDDRARIDQAWAAARAHTTEFNEAYRIVVQSKLRWISVHVAPEYESGHLIGYLGTVSDITSQRNSEDARSRSEAESRATLDAAVDAIATIDEFGTVLSFNRAAQKLFGYSSDEVIGRNVSMLMPEPHRGGHDGYLASYRNTGRARIIGIGRELEGRHKDGSLLPIYLAVSEVIVQGRRTFTGIMRDISREKASQEEIRRQNERLSVTVRNAPMGIVTYRFGQAFASTNRAFESMLGYTGSELERLELTKLTHPEDREELERMTAEAREGRLEQYSLRLRLLRRDGAPIYVIVHTAVTHDQRGAPDLVIAQVEDRSAEIHAKEVERLQQDRLTHVARLSTLGEMTAGIAHEINQPLTAISMYAQSGVRMLEAGIPKPDKLREALEKLTTQSLRAGAVIDRIQRLVRRQETLFEAVQLNELINDILRLAESDARVNDIQITLDLADSLPTVNADPIQIQQVVLNLLRNGIDAMRGVDCRNGSVVKLTTRLSERNEVVVSVTDSGTGVAAEFAPELFTPFATTKHNGMGMGLSICRSIIEAHGGRLGYRNNPDHGATFFFHLPVGHSNEDS